MKIATCAALLGALLLAGCRTAGDFGSAGGTTTTVKPPDT
jgi:hypothetical protein